MTVVRLRRLPLASKSAALLLVASSTAFAADDCPDPLFTCETNRAGKYAQICATELKPGEQWAGIQYRFGAEGAKPDLAYPADAAQGAQRLFFSHTAVGKDYRVEVRFVSGPYTYRVYSYSAQGAGVLVTGADKKVVSHARCIERPHMFPSYLRRALACDAENPHGAAACADKPLRVAR
jgi:hypothetical protein